MGFIDLFRKDSRKLFLDFSPIDSKWRVISWNFDLSGPQERLWVVETQNQNISSIQWSKIKKEKVTFFKNKKKVRGQSITSGDIELKKLMNLCIHSTLKFSLESEHEFLLTPVSGVTTTDYQNETRALQWIQASFGTLQRSLDQFRERPDLILVAAVFSGTEPESLKRVLRVIAFNLDIICYFNPDYSLEMLVFNDKDLGHGRSKTPVFRQIIKVTKPQIYDEIAKLVHRIAAVGEIG